MTLSVLAALALITGPHAMAEEPPAEPAAQASHPMTGTWHIATPEDALRKRLDATIDAVAREFNLLFRDAVRQKLNGATKVCETYTLDVQAEAVHLSCDGRPSVALPRDGSLLHTHNAAGEPVRGRVEVKGDTMLLTWRGEAGGRINEFAMTGDTLVLTSEVSSSRIPKSLSWTVDYKQK